MTIKKALKKKSSKYECTPCGYAVLGLLGVTTLAALALVITVPILLEKHRDSNDKDTVYTLPVTRIQNSNCKITSKQYKYVTVSCETEMCAQIGTEVMARKCGNAVDAAVATLVCMGAFESSKTGIGGGAQLLMKMDGKFWYIDGMATENIKEKDTTAIPGQLAALFEAHQRWGQVPWKELIMPTVDLCYSGIEMTQSTFDSLQDFNETVITTMYSEYTALGTLVDVGSKYINSALGHTLADLAKSSHNFNLSKYFPEDLNLSDNYISEKVQELRPVDISLPQNLSVVATPSKSNASALTYMLNILSGYIKSEEKKDLDLYYHRLIESYKLSLDFISKLGDSEDPSKYFTKAYSELLRNETIKDEIISEIDSAHFGHDLSTPGSTVSVIDGRGNAVVAIGSLGSKFGNGIRDNTTGIIYNNLASVHKHTKFYKLFSPVLLVNEVDGVVDVVGAVGGTDALLSATKLLLDNILLKYRKSLSVASQRLNLEYFDNKPNLLYIEKGVSQTLESELSERGYELRYYNSSTSLQTISVDEDLTLTATNDCRFDAAVDGY